MLRYGVLCAAGSLVCIRDVKFQATGPSLGPKSGPAGLLHGLNATCWAHAWFKMNSLMLKLYTAGLDAGNAGLDAGPTQLSAVPVRCWVPGS